MGMLLHRHLIGGVNAPSKKETPKAIFEEKEKETKNDIKRKNNNGKNISK